MEPTTITISCGKISGSFAAPQSKALLHRYFICNALSAHHSHIFSRDDCDDVQATKRCLTELGLSYIEGWPAAGGKICGLNCASSGSTYRFLLPIACAMNKECRFELSESLAARPMEQVYAALRAHGIKKNNVRNDLVETSGKMTAGTYLITGECEGQTISGLLLALPILKENSTIITEKTPDSESYIDMTIAIMKEYGVDVKVIKSPKEGRMYKIAGSQQYNLLSDVAVEGDWSLAAFWFAAAMATGGTVTCTNLDPDSLQSEKKIIDILLRFGADIKIKRHEEPDGNINEEDRFFSDITVTAPEKLMGTPVDISDAPDLAAPCAIIACAAEGVSVIKNAVVLRNQNTGRLDRIINMINSLGGQSVQTEDGIIIVGCGKNGLEGGSVETFGDHRLVMMASILSNLCRKAVVVEDAEAVSKSYPKFFRDFENLQDK